MEKDQFNSWSTERVVGELENEIEKNVPFEHRESLQPYITELKNRVALFNGDLTPAQVAAGAEAASSS